MGKFVPTIRFRLGVAFGAPGVLTLVGGVATMLRWQDLPGSPAMHMGAIDWVVPVCALVNVVLLAYGYVHLHGIVADGLGRQMRGFRYLSESLDLTRRSAARRMDEFGRGGVWFDRFMQRLEDTVVTVRNSTEHVSTATREIAAGNLDLSSRTESQAASLEQTAASMAELTETVRQNTHNAQQASELASDAAAMADSGNEAVQGVVGTIVQINDEAGKIADITGIIEGIAFQTNILALNAAVEAARAGEQGRGFAVVASEVRSLAQRSSTAAKDIKALIEMSSTTVKEGASQATAAGAAMAQLKQSIARVAAIAGEIALASQEQSRGIGQIAKAVSHMDMATQQNAAMVEQAAAAARSLDEQVERVRHSLSEFKVKA
jgi:methyl-accepting chemotaxis protein